MHHTNAPSPAPAPALFFFPGPLWVDIPRDHHHMMEEVADTGGSDGDVQLPCEMCGQLWPIGLLDEHQQQCCCIRDGNDNGSPSNVYSSTTTSNRNRNETTVGGRANIIPAPVRAFWQKLTNGGSSSSESGSSSRGGTGTHRYQEDPGYQHHHQPQQNYQQNHQIPTTSPARTPPPILGNGIISMHGGVNDAQNAISLSEHPPHATEPSRNASDGDVQLPCEICGQLWPIGLLDEHQQQCCCIRGAS